MFVHCDRTTLGRAIGLLIQHCQLGQLLASLASIVCKKYQISLISSFNYHQDVWCLQKDYHYLLQPLQYAIFVIKLIQSLKVTLCSNLEFSSDVYCPELRSFKERIAFTIFQGKQNLHLKSVFCHQVTFDYSTFKLFQVGLLTFGAKTGFWIEFGVSVNLKELFGS